MLKAYRGVIRGDRFITEEPLPDGASAILTLLDNPYEEKLLRGLKALNEGKGVEHELIEVEPDVESLV
jgi:hypothetical protein